MLPDGRQSGLRARQWGRSGKESTSKGSRYLSDKAVVTAALRDSTAMQGALSALGQIPPFSPVLTRVIATLAQEDVSFGKVADLIEKDTVLAGNILGLVNSAMYGRTGTVSSVRQAISMLGISKLRNAALGLSVAKMWSHLKTPPGWSMVRFNLHSVAVALLADLLSQRLHVIYPEGAFTAGLFHDLGRLLIAVGIPAQHNRALALSREGFRALWECEEEIFQFTHAHVSAEALLVWNLPGQIQNAVCHHHSINSDSPQTLPGEIALSKLIGVADRCVHEMEISIDSVEPFEGDPLSLLERMGTHTEMKTVLEEFEVEFTAIRKFF